MINSLLRPGKQMDPYDDLSPPSLNYSYHLRDLSRLIRERNEESRYKAGNVGLDVQVGSTSTNKLEIVSFASANNNFKIPYKEIVSATNNFSDANLIKGSALGKAYKGQLLRSEQLIDIIAQRFDYVRMDAKGEFQKEISMLSTLKHKNLVSMVGFYDGRSKIIIYKHEGIGFLDTFLRDPTLTWTRRLQICVGVAHALRYIYYDEGRDFSIIHCDIRSSKILLDSNWEAKLFGFELSLKQKAHERDDLCITDVFGTVGYRDPIYDKSGSVTHKSDIYSFGIVLFEVLFGKKAVDEDNRLLAPFAKTHYEGRRLDDTIDPGLRKQMDPQSFQIFSEIAYRCVKEERSQRPNIDEVVLELEKALEYQQKHENSFISKASVECRTSKNFKDNDVKHLEIPLIDIEKATENFAETYLIGSGGFGDVYKAELDHFDSEYLLPLEENINIGERPKKRNIVALKQIKIRQDKQGEEGFYAEIEMLSSCKHPNIVSLLGFCQERSNMILVYEYASKGSLTKYLGSTNKLTWVQRINISIDIARGLHYLHTKIEDERRIIHRDIKSDNILLSETWEAKIADFGLSRFRPENQEVNTIITKTLAGTDYYLDPQYEKAGKLNDKTDIYSLGVVLFEMLSGKLANDPIYVKENSDGIAHVARRRFKDRTIKEMVDPWLWKETNEKNFSHSKGPNRYALHAFLEIAYQCVAETQYERPTAEVIIKKLEEALSFQEGNLNYLAIPLTHILSQTQNFSKIYLIDSGAYGEVYKAELEHFDRKRFLSFEKKNEGELSKKHSVVAIKRILTREEEKGFRTKIDMLSSCKHPNIVSLLGFCVEEGHMILVYEHASNGRLADYLGSTYKLTNLTWVQRIKICIDVARGLNYLHQKVEDELRMIHIDIKTANIFLGENWDAKIAGLGLSEINPDNALYTKKIAGTQVYLDLEYDITGKLENETNIYSFGVILFEVLFGRFANDPVYTMENSNGIASFARRRFQEGTIKDMIDPRLMEETHENRVTRNKGPYEASLDAYIKIAYQCVADNQTDRPTAEIIVRKLEEALYFQENIKDHLKISLADIKLATQNFSNDNLIGHLGGIGSVYKGQLTHANGRNTFAVKRLDTNFNQRGNDTFHELQSLLEYKHENVVGIVGYCFENGESIIVYDYTSRGSLDRYLKDNALTWMRRLKICIDIASGLNFLQGSGVRQEAVLHQGIQLSKILLNDNWKAKFALSYISPIDNNPFIDPLYIESGILTEESNIYSLGMVLIEILSGGLMMENIKGTLSQNPNRFFEQHYKEGKFDEIVFEGIKEQIAPKSLTTFVEIANQCLSDKRDERPKIVEVLLQLKQALEFQEDYDTWDPKLPNDYKEVFKMSNSLETYLNEKKKDLYDMLSKGILLEEGQMLFTLGENGERNVLISAKNFSYINRSLHRWCSIPESRFPVVAKMSDILNLKTEIYTRTQYLSPDVVYGVYLVFKFCEPRKISSKPLYVNLKYKNDNESSHAYFATWRENEWMMIELWRFLNEKEDINFNFLLESFSQFYCEDSMIYVEGIEFRPITHVKYEEIGKLKKVQSMKSDKDMDVLQLTRVQNEDAGEKLYWSHEVNGKKHLTLSAKAVLEDYYNVELFKTIPSAHSRFSEVIQLLPQQVFRINCHIQNQMLSRDIEYVCYLVFNLSEKSHGLHYPVKVRDLLQWSDKEVEILYFRSPRPWNLHGTNQAPKERADGLMEVKLWILNSNHEFKEDHFHINLRLTSYEGTMSGLIVCGLEFRPMYE